MTNGTMTKSDETPVLLVHSHGEIWYNSIHNMIAAFGVFALAIFICGLVFIKKEVRQTILKEMDKIQKKLFPGGPGAPGGGDSSDSDDEDGASDSGENSSNHQDDTDQIPPSGSNANMVWLDLQKKAKQQKGNKANVLLSGNRMSTNDKGKPPQSQPRPSDNSRRCDYCGLYPHAAQTSTTFPVLAAEREHDEIFYINSNISTNNKKTNQSSYFLGTSIALSSDTQMESTNEGNFEIYKVFPSSVYNNAPTSTDSQYSNREYGLQDLEMFGNDNVSHTMRNRFPQESDGCLNYLGGMLHIQGNEANNNARISAYNQRSKSRTLWEEVSSRDELHTNVNYFQRRNCP